MREIGHFIGGKAVAGTSGRFGDVFNPNTGEVQARVAFAKRAEVEAAIANAEAAQPAWAATNPQRRARVLFKFLELAQKEFDSLAKLLSSEHGKTVADSKGDIQRGLEVVEFACGIPHLLKGEFSESAGPGIDLFSLRQPLGVVAGITPFNFPAMIPMWKFAPALACGNAFILKPSERDPGVPMRLAELLIEAGLPAGVLNVVNGDKEAVDTLLTDPRIRAVGFVGSSAIAEYIYTTGCAHGKRVQCFGGAKNMMVVMPDADMDQAVDALIGAGYGSAGERCMAVSVAVPVGQKTADLLVEKLVPRVESLKVGPSTDPQADYGPLVTKAHLEKVRSYVDLGIKEGAKLKVDGRAFRLQGYEQGFFMGGCLFDEVTPEMRIYKEELWGGAAAAVRARLRQRRRHLHPRRRHRPRLHQSGQCRHGRGELRNPGAARLLHLRRLEAFRLRRSQPARPRRGALLHQDQDGDRPLAFGREGRRRVRHPDDAVSGMTEFAARLLPKCFNRCTSGWRASPRRSGARTGSAEGGSRPRP